VERAARPRCMRFGSCGAGSPDELMVRRLPLDQRLEGVAATSLLTAAARALETERGGGLLSDPLARALAGTKGFELLRRGAMGAVAANGSPSYVVRHRFLDDLLMDLTASSDIRQVVLLGAGLDTRAFRLDWAEGTRLFEIDQSTVFAHKEAVLDAHGATARCERVVVPADLQEDWPEVLLASDLDPSRPTVWVAEGILFYLPVAAVGRLLGDAYRLSAPGSCLAADMMSASPGPSQPFKDLFASLGAPFLFLTDDLAGLMRSHNWDVTEISYDEVARRVGTELAARGRVLIGRRL
jgi:methyltransferase (TIGR00027 family)